MISFLVNQSLGHHAVSLPKQPKVLMQPHVTPRQGSEVSTQVLHLSLTACTTTHFFLFDGFGYPFIRGCAVCSLQKESRQQHPDHLWTSSPVIPHNASHIETLTLLRKWADTEVHIIDSSQWCHQGPRVRIRRTLVSIVCSKNSGYISVATRYWSDSMGNSSSRKQLSSTSGLQPARSAVASTSAGRASYSQNVWRTC